MRHSPLAVTRLEDRNTPAFTIGVGVSSMLDSLVPPGDPVSPPVPPPPPGDGGGTVVISPPPPVSPPTTDAI